MNNLPHDDALWVQADSSLLSQLTPMSSTSLLPLHVSPLSSFYITGASDELRESHHVDADVTPALHPNLAHQPISGQRLMQWASGLVEDAAASLFI